MRQILIGATTCLTAILVSMRFSYSESLALERMQATFVGSPSESQIKSTVDTTLLEYGESISEENYDRVGRVLARLRKMAESDGRSVTEMQMLQCALAADPRTARVNVKLPDMLAICSIPNYGNQ